ELRQVYDETQEAYDFISGDLKRVYSQILNIVDERENRRYAVNMIFGCLLVAEFCLVLWYLLKNAYGMDVRIVRPIQPLVQEAKSVETGNLDDSQTAVPAEACSEEVEILFRAFASMKHRLYQQMQEMIANAALKMR